MRKKFPVLMFKTLHPFLTEKDILETFFQLRNEWNMLYEIDVHENHISTRLNVQMKTLRDFRYKEISINYLKFI